MRTGSVLGLAAAVIASFSSELEIVAAAAVVACLVAGFSDRAVLRRVLGLGLVVGAVFAAAVTAAAVAWASGVERGAVVGVTVLLRIVVLATAAALIARSVDAESILRLLSRIGMRRLGTVFGLALNCLPHLSETVETVWVAHRVRSDGRWRAIVGLPALAEVLLAHTGRTAERATAAAALRGHTALARPATPALSTVRTVVVTGSPGSGKTPLVAAVVDALGRHGVPVSGFLQPAVIEDGQKVGFCLRDVATGDEALLARRVAPGAGRWNTAFEFDPAGFELGARALGRVGKGSVLVVDELGPVEVRGDGHWPAVRRAVATAVPRGLLLVVRRALVPSLLEALDATDVVVVDLDAAADGALDRVLDALTPPL